MRAAPCLGHLTATGSTYGIASRTADATCSMAW